MLQRMRIAAVALVVLAMTTGVFASENIIKFFERQDDTWLTQGEWAVYLVKAIGDADKVPGSSSQIDYIALLEKNRIAPLDGWQSLEYLTYGDKAVTMVQALGLSDELPADATEVDYIWYLDAMGFHEGQPTELVHKTEALNRNINDPIFQEVTGSAYNINVSEFSPFTPNTAGR